MAKQADRPAKALVAAHTFEVFARQWLKKTATTRAASTQEKVTTWLEKDVFPYVGRKPISTIGPRNVLLAVQKIVACGAIVSAHRVKQICGQVFRYAVTTGLAEQTSRALRQQFRREPRGRARGSTENAAKINHEANRGCHER
jgi:Phage integrase, N-terminal SAM-like domain